MEIKTKYNLFDEVFVLENNRVKKIKIFGIDVSANVYPTSDIGKLYNIAETVVYKDNDGNSYSEKDLFLTKEELLKTL